MHNLNPKIENLIKKDLTPRLRADSASKLFQAVSTIRYYFDVENYENSQHASKFLHDVTCLADRIKHLRTAKYAFGDKIKFWKKSAIVCGIATVTDEGCVGQNSEVKGAVQICDNAWVTGNSVISGNIKITGDTEINNEIVG